MIFRRARFGDVIARQLDLFEREERELVREAQEKLDAYNAADRDDAEELYGDYLLVVESGVAALAELRDRFARTLEDDVATLYEREFNRAVAKRLPRFALDLENS